MGNNGRVIRSWLVRVYRSRPVRTFAQTLAALISAAVASGQGVDAVNWHNAVSVSLLAAAYSALLLVAESTHTKDRPPDPRQPAVPTDLAGDTQQAVGTGSDVEGSPS